MLLLFFFAYIISLLVISHYAAKRLKKDSEDYLTTGRSMPPWVVAFSAIGTNYSGFLFLGQAGFIFNNGLQTVVITIGWKLGDFVTMYFAHRRLRLLAAETGSSDYLSLIFKLHSGTRNVFAYATTVLALVFLCFYAAAQITASTKIFQNQFSIDWTVATLLTVTIIGLYSLKGGMRSSMWTDCLQTFIMLVSLSILAAVIIYKVPSIDGLFKNIKDLGPSHLSLFPKHLQNSHLGLLILFVVGWIFGGIGTLGQPHVMSRFLTLEDPSQIKRVRRIYIPLSIFLFVLILFISLSARTIIDGAIDGELVLPILSEKLSPGFLNAVLLVGILSAVFSTVDSQILSATAISDHFLGYKKNIDWQRRKAFFIFLAASGAICVFRIYDIFNLVIFAWASLASCFVPLVFYGLAEKHFSMKQSFIVVLTGISSALLWRFSGYNIYFYDTAVGIVAGLIVGGLSIFLTKKKTA